jgi:hypothetical protein
MKKSSLLLATMLTFSIAGGTLFGQAAGEISVGPYTLRNSSLFDSPKGHQVQSPISFGNVGIIQINPSVKDFNSYSFQLFSQDLKLKKETFIELKGRVGENVSFPFYPAGSGIIKFKNKTYLFMREVMKSDKGKVDGLSVLEFFPDKLDFAPKSKNLFTAGGKVSMQGWGFYDIKVSNDQSKFLCQYALYPKDKDNKVNKEIIGLQVFDEDLNKLWGAEIEMPYVESLMDNLGFTLTNDGKVCLLAKVYEGEVEKKGKNKVPPKYHFEVFVYQKDGKEPKKIEISLDNLYNKEAYIYETNNGIAIAGFYGQERGRGIDGAYTVTLDIDKAVISKLNGGYYEIPTEFIKSFMSDKEVEKTEEKMDEEGGDLELNNLHIRKIYTNSEGGIKIVSEVYFYMTSYTSNGGSVTHNFYRDAVVMSLKGGKLEWINKIPKNQYSTTARGCSINSLMVGDKLHVFWKDKPENSKLAEGEKPIRFGGINGMLRGCMFDSKGKMTFTDIVDVAPYDMHFDIQDFVKGGNNNLISTERRSKENMIFSIDVKQ